MKARQTLANILADPKTKYVVLAAFEQAWDVLEPTVGSDLRVRDQARLRLAEIVVAAMDDIKPLVMATLRDKAIRMFQNGNKTPP